MVETSLVGNVLNGLSHFHRVRDRAQFAMCLIRGLGGNLTETSREEFAKQVFSFCQFAALANYKIILNNFTHCFCFLNFFQKSIILYYCNS